MKPPGSNFAATLFYASTTALASVFAGAAYVAYDALGDATREIVALALRLHGWQ